MDRLYGTRLVAKNDSMQGRSGPIQLKKYKDLNILKYLYFLNCIGPLLPCMRSFFATSLAAYNRSIVRPRVFVGCLATCHLRPRVALGLLFASCNPDCHLRRCRGRFSSNIVNPDGWTLCHFGSVAFSSACICWNFAFGSLAMLALKYYDISRVNTMAAFQWRSGCACQYNGRISMERFERGGHCFFRRSAFH